MSEKRYGEDLERTACGGHVFEGWTAEDIARNTFSGHPKYVRELARDLIAMQARAVEAEARAADLAADVAALNDGWEATTANLATAEATIAKALDLLERWRTGNERWAFQKLRSALEATLKGTPCK